ncbi:Cytochrome c [Gemmata obscuriglobus]|uniref:Cytochrome c domain-containing protein n=1 Tax=Gemmata obscuriglobus TaxID=114 RepID=A0A2Z3GV16_9BACT|nr:c-type cytochrome [Gemmata obscuriglobus]AWM37138.1 hypothetical protein C1280_08950 [Gemmata obscuriglobus]QEG30133.1 Cytochrome c [Gemmata obscuriglobus]VTS09454.1 probable cytochrome oxidase (cbb3-type) : Probable cytochrome oxidase (Cbb3-type) OS=Planctomyces maris DSM 8797 GN=PM8797T_08489 PE=4 SV=1: Cytochrom_C [Gemmata obscuriglobus UQM 2246]
MRHHHFVFALVALAPAVARAVEPADLKPGLVTRYAAPGAGPAVHRLEPTVAISLSAGEQPHPKLAGTGSINWTGYINITRAGKYTFSPVVTGGTLDVKVGGKMARGEISLDGGVTTLDVVFRREDPVAPVRVELFWRGPGFVDEPLAYQFLGHLAKDRPKEFTADTELDHGRFKFEELGCVKCHTPAAGDTMAKTLADRTGPNLTDVARRAYPGWIYAWLADPTKIRSHTTMPKSFAPDEAGAAERYAVTQYLVSLAGQPLDVYRLPTVVPNGLRESMERGRALFSVAGCAACHSDPLPRKKKDEEDDREPLAPVDYAYGLGTLSGPTPKYALGGLGGKTRPEVLAAYLQNPLKTNPHGRMPNLNLSGGEALDIARYLCRVPDESVTPDAVPVPQVRPAALAAQLLPNATDAELTKFNGLKPETQWAELGARIVLAKGCANCHAIEPGGQAIAPLTTFPGLEAVKRAGAKGCLDAVPAPARRPAYALDPAERGALTAFVQKGLTGAGSSAPVYRARTALRRFNCLNCHQRDGEGGIPTELADQMRQLEKAENADDVRPPVLTGVGHKARTSWLKSVLTQSGRARPWMQLRMPQYGEGNVGFLPDALAALEGTTPDDRVHVVPGTSAKIAAGRTIVGKGGLGCVSCHDIGGVANTGTRGPDLATINQRVRYDWYERWLSQPLRMAPGTRMPQAFVDGKSTLTTAFNGDPKQQAEAMWAYLSLGPNLVLPEGLEPPKGLVIAVKDRAEVLRTFMPDAGSKAIAVGYPGYVSVAFSADQCRTAYAWNGNFLDASPVWNNRGGAPAKLLGQKFWTAPAGHPWGLTGESAPPPDFLGRAANPAFGLPLPLEPARIYDGPMAVKFDGYSLDREGRPTFRYRLDESFKGPELAVTETPAPLRGSVATGLARTFEVTVPGGRQAWFLAGQAAKEPRAVDGAGQPVRLGLKADEVKLPAAGVRLVLPSGDRAVLVEVPGAPAGCEWRFVPVKGVWLAVLKLPRHSDERKVAFTLNLWALPKDDDALIKELFAK